METGIPTERTPLINNGSASEPPSRTFIIALERNIYSDPEYPAVHTIIERVVGTNATSATSPLSLKLLLCLRYLSGSHFQLDKDDWSSARSFEREVADVAAQYWSELQRVAGSQTAFDEALWLQFLLESGEEEHVSLIETILASPAGIPSHIQLDDRIALSLLRVWRRGKPRSSENDRRSSITMALAQPEAFATPRVIHLIDLIIFLTYILMLAHCILYAEAYPNVLSGIDFRFYCLIIYSISRILRDRWPSVTLTPFILTLVTLWSAYPSMPSRRGGPYRILLFSFYMHFIQLTLPYSPSLPFMSPQSPTFPISSILHNLFARVFIPATRLFIPHVFLFLFLLIVTLNDFLVFPDLVPTDFTMYFFIFLIVSLSSLMISLTLFSSSLPPATLHHPDVPESWDAYGANTGLLTRYHFFRSATTYLTPYYFPTPLSLLQLVFVHLPHFFLLLFRQERPAAWLRTTLEPIMWRFTVFPVALIIGTVLISK